VETRRRGSIFLFSVAFKIYISIWEVKILVIPNHQ
jgi:isoprenylcysteine carboxyl methyltransferase (ICMT) family protein YpbQ